MVKVKNSGVLDFFSAVFSFSVSKVSLSFQKLVGFSFLFLFLIFGVSVLTSLKDYVGIDFLGLFFTAFVGLPIVFFSLFGLFYLFLGAFETVKQKFWNSFFMFFLMSMFFVFLGNLFNYLSIFVPLAQVLVVLTLISFAVVLVLNLKDYFKVSFSRTFFCLVLIVLLFAVATLIQYLVYLLSLIRQ